MLPTLGPPAPTAPGFSPVPQTQSITPPVAPAAQPYGEIRRAGSATRPMGDISSEPYEPPPAFREILVRNPASYASGVGATQQADSGYQRPGLPYRATVNPFGDDPLGSFLGGDAGVIGGLVPGQQRGGTTHGIATTPLTLANFSTWSRERVLALALSMGGSDWQQPENAMFGDQPEGPKDGGGPVDWFTKGVNEVGNLVWSAIDAPMTWYRNSNAFNRGKNVRELFQRGSTEGFVIEKVTSSIFGGAERFTIEGLQRAAARQGIDLIDATAKLYDMSPAQVAAIAQDPWITDEQLGQIMDGTPLSTDPGVNLALEGAMLMATMAVGGVGAARAGAKLAEAGAETLGGAFGAGLRGGVALAPGASRALQAARLGGTATRRLMQIDSWNKRVGWAIGGAEWGIKQLAAIAGDEELVKAMDRLMWQMPLSMNPGWNLIDGFASHPLRDLRAIRRGQLDIGSPESPGYVGRLDLRSGSLRDAEGRALRVTVGGRELKLGTDHEATRLLGKLRDLTPEDIHAQFFARPDLGYTFEEVNRYFGEGNPWGLTWDDARNGIFHMALEAVREGKGVLGRTEGLELPTQAMRGEFFVKNNAKGALKMLERNFTGESSAMVDLFRSDGLWDLAARNDSGMAALKAPIGAWGKNLALSDFASWLRASKIVREAIAKGVASDTAVAAYRRTLNRDYIARWRASLAERFAMDEIVPVSMVNELKKAGGFVEGRGKGRFLTRGHKETWTRRELEAILDDVERADDEARRAQNTPPRVQRAAAARGVDPNVDTLEAARLADISPDDVNVLNKARKAPPLALPPQRLVAKIAKAMGRSVDSIMSLGPEAAWGELLKWFDTRLAEAADTGTMRVALEDGADSLRARMAEGRLDPALGGEAIAAFGRIGDEMLSPLDPKHVERMPHVYREWNATMEESKQLALDLDRHLKDPRRNLRIADPAPGQTWVLPRTASPDALKRLSDLIEKAIKDESPFLDPAERDRLLDASIHPLLKADVLPVAVNVGDRPALAAILRDLGGEPREIAVQLVNDAGLDPMDLRGSLIDLTGQVIAYGAEADDIAGRAVQLAQRFARVGGSWSDELAETSDRILTADKVYKAAQKGKRQPIMRATLDPEDPAREASARQRQRRTEAENALSAAEAKRDMWQRAVDDPTSWRPPRAEDLQNHRVPIEGGRFTKGEGEFKRAQAEVFAAEWQRDHPGDIVMVEKVKGGAYEVQRIVPGDQPRTPHVPAPPSSVVKMDTLEEVRAFDDKVLVTNGRSAQDPELLGLILAPRRVADPTYAPEEMARVEAYVRERRADLEAQIAAGRPQDTGATDPRMTLLSILDSRITTFEKRAAAKRTRVESAPLAEGPGDTVPPRADVSTQQAPTRLFHATGKLSTGQRYDAPDPAAYGRHGPTWWGPGYYASTTPERASFWYPQGRVDEWVPTRPLNLLDEHAPPPPEVVKAMSDVYRSVMTTEGRLGELPTLAPDASLMDAYHTFQLQIGKDAPAGAVAVWQKGVNERLAGEGYDGVRHGLPMGEAGDRDIVLFGRPAIRRADAPLTGAAGSFQDPTTEAARQIPYELRVVEADSILNSWDEGYPGEYQMRERRQGVIDRIAEKPDPERLLRTENPGEGTPVMLPDGTTVFAGNHRAQGIRDATEEAYLPVKAALLRRAADFGLDPGEITRFRKPVLVRVLPEGVASPELALAMNRASGGLTAQNIARTLDDALSSEDWARFHAGSGDIDATLKLEANNTFIGRIQQILPESERARFLSDGRPTPEGVVVIKTALVGRALGDAASPLVGRLVTTGGESPLGRYGKGFMAAAPRLIRALALGRMPIEDVAGPIRRSLELLVTPPTLERLGPSLVKALKDDPERLARAQESVLSMSRDQALRYFEGMGDDPVAATFAYALWNTKQNTAAEVTDILEAIAREVEALPDPNAPSLFDEAAAAPPFETIANRAIASVNEARRKAAGDTLIAVEEIPFVEGPDRVTTVPRQDAPPAYLHRVTDDEPAVIDAITGPVGDLELVGSDLSDAADRIGKSTGRVIFTRDTPAEAERLTRYLAGDDSAILHRRFRVVNGEYEPLGDIRGEIVDRIDGRYKAKDSREKAIAYLHWKLTGEGLGDLNAPPNIKKFVDGEMAYRQGREVPTDPALPAVRKALAGREYEVRVVGQEPVAPEVPAAPPTRIVKRKDRRVEPRYEERTGLTPEAKAIDNDAHAAASGTAHTIVSSTDEYSERAAQKATGAPLEHQPRVVEMNRPGQEARLAAARAGLDAAQAEVEKFRAALERLRPADDVPPPAEILMGEELGLYHRYIAQPGVIGEATRQPRTLDEAYRALESLDLGIPPLTGTMTPAEMSRLKGALLRVIHARLDELGAPRVPKRDFTSRQRAGAGLKHDRRAPEEDISLDPDDYSSEMAEVMRTLQGRVFESDDPLAGWEGTQYEIGVLPTKARDGGPLSPRIQYDAWVDRLDELVPGLGDELVHGRKRAWVDREADARFTQAMRSLPGRAQLATLRGLVDTAVGSRPERQIVGQAIDRFTALMLKHFDGDAEEYQKAVQQVHGIIGAWHDHMSKQTIAKFPRYRRLGLLPQDQAEQVAREYFGADMPAWLNDFLLDASKSGRKHPIAEAWREADNRIRAYFANRPGGMSEFLDHLYGGRTGQRLHEAARNATVGYHMFRFLIDLRWLGLEYIEAPTLVAFREGFGAMWEGMGKGANAGKRPLFMDDLTARTSQHWAWWIAQSDPGVLLRTRERYIAAIVRRYQEQEFPRAMEAYLRGMERVGGEMADLAGIIRTSGDTPMGWLRKLDADQQLALSRSRPLERGEAERLFKPWLDRGVIQPAEYEQFVKAGRWTGHPAIDRELAYLADERLRPLIERIAAINEQGWNDAATLIFGQVDRSNLQRLMNHPLLYWPISYQIKATKWLAGLLFDRAFGMDTGAAGAVTLGMLHQMHKDRMTTDPEYANAIVSNPTLLFVAQMLFPITPWDLGVGLSPFTRLAIDPEYQRNPFGVGPGYTYFQLLPRLLYEQSKPGSWAQSMQAGVLPIPGLVSGAQQRVGYSVPVAPPKGSQLGNVQAGTYGQPPPPSQPFQNPDTRFR